MRTGTHRPAVLILHRAWAEKGERQNMESYRTQIIAMLDTIEDAKMMRMIHHVIRAIMMSR